MKILIADDDPQILRALQITLSAHGYDVVVARDGAEAIALAAAQRPELLVVDLGMPQLTGIQVIEAVRGWSSAPILVVSGRSDSADKVDALDAGADDYVTKPFAVDELLARIRALTRRTPTASDEPVIRFGNITVDLAARQVTRRVSTGTAGDTDEIVRLTPTEWQVLEVLVRNPRRLVSRQVLLTEVWGPQYTNDTGYLRLYLSQLRKKLEPTPSEPRYLLTESGMGYRFNPDAG
ncbi:response regulator [Microterricola viridarii]|uniref:Two-component system, OmpR family, KDP operon response regulator KdpE n=1 Tax=Microterricola viridarii TaxID=412690 RepID=A0A1H1V229_9MICO|nr:response regulator transcription factor [Microterricola viridarii]SDS78857.1 two-component system, OmpR family, KDP operon response regulator KdpE [Microterricola viridarii]